MINKNKKVRVFTLGNAFLGDAGVGLSVGDELSHSLTKYPVEIYSEDETDFSIVKDFDITEPIIIIKGILSVDDVGTIKSFNMNPDVGNQFSAFYNIDEIPSSLHYIIDKRFGEIIVINIKSMEWSTCFSVELLEKFGDITKKLEEKIKDYSCSYI